ncbi:MAG: hypothetical protein M0C28_13600 [Candidatus Moduliflexus flocculans]|nr:hypothetical protein [Candidatus Moduliflexus flocculans]
MTVAGTYREVPEGAASGPQMVLESPDQGLPGRRAAHLLPADDRRQLRDLPGNRRGGVRHPAG